MYLQINEEPNQTLVVTPSNDKKTMHMPKIILPIVAPHSKSQKSKTKD
jgi:hypothetical protein